MAKRTRARAAGGGTRQTVTERIVVQMPRASAATRRAPRARAPLVVRARKTVRRHAAQTGLHALIGTAIAGILMGKIDSGAFPFPTLPGLGRAGSIAVVAGILAKKHPLLAKLAVAAAAIGGYEYGRHGSISGDDSIMGGVVSQV